MGDRIGWWLVNFAPERFTAFVLGGCPGSAVRPDERLDERINAARKGAEAYVDFLHQLLGGAPLTTEAREQRIQELDVQAQLALALALRNRPGVEGALPGLRAPCFVYAGEEDTVNYEPTRECAFLVPSASFLSLPRLSHGEAFTRIDLVLPEIERFLNRSLTTRE